MVKSCHCHMSGCLPLVLGACVIVHAVERVHGSGNAGLQTSSVPCNLADASLSDALQAELLASLEAEDEQSAKKSGSAAVKAARKKAKKVRHCNHHANALPPLASYRSKAGTRCQLYAWMVLNPSDRICSRLAAPPGCRPACQRAALPSRTPTLQLLSWTASLHQNQTMQARTQLPSLQPAKQMAAQLSRSHSIQTAGVAL